MVVIFVISTIITTLVAVLIPWLPESASEEMDGIVFTYWFATVICIGIFALVTAVIIEAVMSFRVQPDDDTDGPPIHGHTGLEIAWTVVPAILVIAIGVVSAVVLSQNADARDGSLKVRVFAQQFAWTFRYGDDVRSDELVLPLDRSVEFEFTSADVIHSFWIPEMGQKQDVVPGISTDIVVTPTRTGRFTLVCTELCGLGHSTMRAPVRVLEQGAFDQWLEQRAAAAEEEAGGGSTGGEGEDGRRRGRRRAGARPDDVRGGRLRRLPRVRACRQRRGDRACVERARGNRRAGRCPGGRVRPSGHRRARSGARRGLPGRGHAKGLRREPDARAARRARRVSERRGRNERMTATVEEHAAHGTGDGHHAPPAPPRGRLMRPGYLRAIWTTSLFFLLGMYIVVTVRWIAGWDPVYQWEIIVLVAGMVTAPLGFLLGIGAFDYWLYWISGRPTVADDHANHGAYRWQDYFKVNTDHKVIGVQYLVTTFFFFLAGGFLAMLFRAELAQPGMQFFDTQTYNGLVSAHATLMIFVFIIPAFAGLANFAVPLMLGAPDMAFPRLNALSFWMLPIAGVLFMASFLAPGGAFATGWTSYAPLASEQPFGQVFFNMGVQWAGASSIATALNFLVTIITMRAPGMTFWRMPLLVWANFTTSLLVVIATPFIAGSQFFVMFDRMMNTSFFTPENGGYVLGYQHIFWFYSHPAVYIMILPGFGIISEIIAVMSRKPIFGYRLMAISLLGILVLGFSVWAHHMFVAGMADWLRVPMMISTLLIAVPTGVKVFSWLATLWEGKIHLNTPMLFALGFVSMFVIGGLSGIYLAAVPIDIHASDTYFIVAHIHYVLFGGSVFTIFAGIYYWFPKMTGRMYNERLGKLHFWLTFVWFNVTFFPMHWVGLVGMPRRVADYAGTFGALNMVVTIASFALGASVVIFMYNIITSWARGPLAGDNPWRAMTIEWQVTSPPPVFNFDEIPQVVGGPYEYGVPGAKHAVLKGGALQEARV